MFVLVVPRILSMSLIVAYTKAFAIFFILALIFFNIVMNIPHLKKNPVQVLLGTMTNVFAPCIVIDEGSRFYKWAGTIASSIHALSLIVLNCLVIGGAIIPCPDLLKKSYPPVLHCYPGIYRFYSCTYFLFCAQLGQFLGQILGQNNFWDNFWEFFGDNFWWQFWWHFWGQFWATSGTI